MPVITKTHQSYLINQLNDRYDNLKEQLKSRELKNSREGCSGHKHWVKPEVMCATSGSKIELSLAVEDFKSILQEVKKLK